MVCEKERAIFSKNGWRKIETCSFCGCRYWEENIKDYICFELIFNGISRRNDDVLIDNLNGIKSNCPLPLWDKVKKHDPKDKPKKLKPILIKFKDTDINVIKTRTGWLNDTDTPTWTVHGHGVLEDRDVIEWGYINGGI